MFGFKKKDPKARLEAEYTRLLEESHQLSTVDRKRSDDKAAEAAAVLEKLQELEKGDASS